MRGIDNSMSFEIDISCQTTMHQVDLDALKAAIIHGLTVEQVRSAVLSVTIVDNTAMQRLNRQHLNHDYPTDVISFQLDWRSSQNTPTDSPPETKTGRSVDAGIEGEVIVSVEYASETAAACGWNTQDELTLYAIHGMLHICGYDDLTASEKEIMRGREKAILSGLGLSPQYPSDLLPKVTCQEDDEPPGTAVPNDVTALKQLEELQ